MKFLARCVSVTLLSLFLAVPRAGADPITIVSGSFVFGPGQPGRLTMTGDSRGLAVDAGVAIVEGSFPGSDCFCLPGELVPLGANYVDAAFAGGTISLDGNVFPRGMPDLGGATLTTVFSAGSVLLPDLPDDDLPLTFSSPFTFTGLVFPPNVDGSGEILDVLGRGQVTVTFRPQRGDEAWRTQSFRYEFQDPSVIPEPGTWLLIASGLSLAALRRRRRQTSTT